MMIPKIIHYCWFGKGPLPDLAIKCIDSWKRFFPDYEIKRWDENNFDVLSIPYTAEAYYLKKYAYVSDYARYWILYNYGGLYFDTDVEVIKDMTDIVEKGAFMGMQSPRPKDEKEKKSNSLSNIAPGLGLGANPGLGLYKEVLDYYKKQHFVDFSGKMSPTIVKITSDIFQSHKQEILTDGVVKVENEIYLYPDDYFCPLNYWTGELKVTSNTRSIHHYAASWINKKTQKTFSKKILKWRYRIVYLLSMSKIIRFLY